MIMPEELRRELLKALYSAERLFYLYRKCSFFQEQPSNTFLKSLWHTVSTGEMPPITFKSDILNYIRSDDVPPEDECHDIDQHGYAFIRTLETIANFLEDQNPKILELVYLDIETSNIDGIIIDLIIGENETLLITREVREEIDSHPMMIKLLKQLEIDSAKAEAINLTPTEVEASKCGSIYDITLYMEFKR